MSGLLHPITLFNSVSLLAAVALFLVCLCLRKQPHKSTSYQVGSPSVKLKVNVELSVNDLGECWFSSLFFQMSGQSAEGTFSDADRSAAPSTTASSVAYPSFHLEILFIKSNQFI